MNDQSDQLATSAEVMREKHEQIQELVRSGEAQSDACRELGVHPQRYSAWKSAQKPKPSLHTLVVPETNHAEVAEIKLLAKMLMDKVARL